MPLADGKLRVEDADPIGYDLLCKLNADQAERLYKGEPRSSLMPRIDQIFEFRLNPRLTNTMLNALFSTGWPSWQNAPDTSDWQPVLQRSLVYVCAFDAQRLIGFVNVAWDG